MAISGFDKRKMPRNVIPTDTVISVTDNCNSQCAMCNIWQSESKRNIPLDYLNNLPTTLKYINVSGGEPFLRTDLVDVIKSLINRCPKANVIISTNGFLTKRISKTMARIKKYAPHVGVAISIDGIGDIHDKIRGIPGSFKQATATVEELIRAGFTNLRLAFTAAKGNVAELSCVYNLANKYGIQFTCSVAHNSEIFFKTSSNNGLDRDELHKQLSLVARKELMAFKPKKWLRAYFYQGLLGFALGEPRLLPCVAGRNSFFVNTDGSIYPCYVLNVPMGNLKTKDPFDKTWNSSKALKARSSVSNCQKNCWMICTTRVAIKQAPINTSAWVIKNKIKAHLGASVF